MLGSEGVIADLGRGVGEAAQQGGLAAVGRADQHHLRGPFPLETQAPAMPRLPPRRLLLLLERCQAALQVGEKVVRALVLGQEGDHLLQAGHLFVDGPGFAERCLCPPVFGRDVGRHPPRIIPPGARGGQTTARSAGRYAAACAPRRRRPRTGGCPPAWNSAPGRSGGSCARGPAAGPWRRGSTTGRKRNRRRRRSGSRRCPPGAGAGERLPCPGPAGSSDWSFPARRRRGASRSKGTPAAARSRYSSSTSTEAARRSAAPSRARIARASPTPRRPARPPCRGTGPPPAPRRPGTGRARALAGATAAPSPEPSTACAPRCRTGRNKGAHVARLQPPGGLGPVDEHGRAGAPSGREQRRGILHRARLVVHGRVDQQLGLGPSPRRAGRSARPRPREARRAGPGVPRSGRPPGAPPRRRRCACACAPLPGPASPRTAPPWRSSKTGSPGRSPRSSRRRRPGAARGPLPPRSPPRAGSRGWPRGTGRRVRRRPGPAGPPGWWRRNPGRRWRQADGPRTPG